MILARPDLELLHRRVLMRAIPGGVLSFALAFEVVCLSPANPRGFFWLLVSGLVIGVLTAVIHRWRMENDLLERKLAIDVPWFAIPLAAVAAMASPWARFYWDVATLVLAARAVLSIQELITEWTLYRLLVAPPQPETARARPAPRSSAEHRHVTGLQLMAMDVNQPARCPVCADDIADDKILCADCQTPHHGQCFTYNGRCGVYGCGGGRTRGPIS